MAGRHSKNAKLFATLGGFAPTLGILGTVLSLVHVLENLSNPGALGHSIAGVHRTLYGVGSGEHRLPADRQPPQGLSEVEVMYREMISRALALRPATTEHARRAARHLPRPAERGAAKKGLVGKRRRASLLLQEAA
jgi:hypothetical protein